jgi:hypothetical protein
VLTLFTALPQENRNLSRPRRKLAPTDKARNAVGLLRDYAPSVRLGAVIPFAKATR